ncbi:MAG: hypothetical protein M3Q49_11680 [Actinomycetota bacterium]|nr:hypothetical protein [Actinomycetota bacterium]
MARPSRREKRQAGLRCNNCGNEFLGMAWYASIETPDRGTIGWNKDKPAARCPSCGSNLTGFRW